MSAAGVGFTYFLRGGVIGVMCCIIGTAGIGTNKATSFRIPDKTCLREV